MSSEENYTERITEIIQSITQQSLAEFTACWWKKKAEVKIKT